MGARNTKLDSKSEQETENLLGNSAKRRFISKILKKRRSTELSKEDDQLKTSLNFQGKEEPKMKKKSLQELHMDPPPGFRKFEAEVDWQNMDHDIALQLWEDVFKPLYTFYSVRRISPSGPSVTVSW